MSKRLFLTAIVILLLSIGLLPLLSMLLRSLFVDGHFSLSYYADVLTSTRQWVLMEHSVALSSLVTLLTVAAGVPLGVLLAKTDLPLRRFFTALFVIPLLVPPYILAVSWFELLGREGLLSHWVDASVTQFTSRLLFALPGCTFVLFCVFLPLPMLFTMIFLRMVNPRLEEAGRLVSNWRGVLRVITLPLVMPGVLLSAVLVFLLSFGEFSVPNFLRYTVFPVESFTQFAAFYNVEAATAAAMPLAAVTLILLLAENAFLRDKTYRLRPSPVPEHLPPIKLGSWRTGLTVLVALSASIIVLVPVMVLLIQAGGIDAYAEALQRAGDSLLRSFFYAISGATVLTLLGFFCGYLIHTRTLRCWRCVDSLTLFLFALPGTIIGIGLISLWNTPWTNLIYATPVIIIIGYMAKYTALTSRMTVTQLAQIPHSMEEAAQVAGAGWFRTMIFIMIPLARGGLIAGWLMGYIFSLRDTGITMLVYPAGHETLPIRIFTLMANGSPQLIAALCLLMIAVTLLPAGILWILWGGLSGKVTQ